MKFSISKEKALEILKIYQADMLGWCRDLSYTPTKKETSEALIMAYMTLCNTNSNTGVIKALINNQQYNVELPKEVTNDVIDKTIDKALNALSNENF